MTHPPYVGGELELFAQADRWKRYWISRLRPYIRGSALEVGAGIGANTRLLRADREQRWVCLEPDSRLAESLRDTVLPEMAGQEIEVRTGTIESLEEKETFDTILYIDVLEHIEDDRGEVCRAAEHLRRGGHLIVLSPAHAWLFSEFDRSIGHYRRYSGEGLAALTPAGLRLAKCFYLDAVGLFASAANRLFLKQSLPNTGQLRLWDNVMVPCSRLIDPIMRYRFGKSVVCIWERPL